MKWILVLLCLLVASECDRIPSYDFSPPPAHIITNPPATYGPTPGPGPSYANCGPNEILHVDGRCIVPESKDHVFLIRVPPRPKSYAPPPYIPPPKVWNNVLFVDLPEEEEKSKTVVVPPPPQKNTVYVLRKKTKVTHDVETLPTPPKTNPEVYFIDYNIGENPLLPNGIDLQSALSHNAQHIDGQVIGGGNTYGSGIIHGGGSSSGIIHGGGSSGGIIHGGASSGGIIHGGGSSSGIIHGGGGSGGLIHSGGSYTVGPPPSIYGSP